MQSKEVTHDSYSTENQEKEDKPKEEEAKEPVAEEKPKTRSSQPKELAPAFMSNIFAALDIYMTKMLVRPHPALSPAKPSISCFFSRLLLPSNNCWSIIKLSSAGLLFSLQNYLARNFYNMRFLALFVCFAINFILLFYKVTKVEPHQLVDWLIGRSAPLIGPYISVLSFHVVL